MSRQRQPQIERKSAWLPPRHRREASLVRRYAQRFFWAAILVGLLVGFMKLLSRPLQSTATQLLILQGQDPSDPTAPDPMAFRTADFLSLETTASTLRRNEHEPSRVTLAPRLAVRDELNRLADELDKGIDHPSDAIVAYVKADGLLSDGVPHLRWQFDPKWTRETTLPVIDLLRMLSQRQCSVKLLVLDCGTVDYDLAHGTLVNRFVTELQAQVDQVNDSTLWVLTSRSDFEASHFSRSLGQSVFAHMFSNALSSLADHDGDGSLTVVEAYRFVNQHTAAWIEQKSAGRLSQTPQLFHAGVINWARTPEILALNRTWQPNGEDGSDQTPAADESEAGEGLPESSVTAPSTAMVQLLQPVLASRAVAPFIISQRSRADEPTSTAVDSEAGKIPNAKSGDADSASAVTSDAEADSSQGNETNDADTETGGSNVDAAETTSDSPDESMALSSAGTLENPAWSALIEVWQQRDQLLQRSDSPATFAPHRIRVLEAQLQRRQPAVIFANEEQAQEVIDDLKKLWQGASNLPELEGVISPAMRELALLWPAPVSLPTSISGAGQRQLAGLTGWKIADAELAQIDQFEQLVSEAGREPLEDWLAELKPLPIVERECQFARRLLQDRRLDWPQISGLLQLRLRADRTAVASAMLPGMLEEAVMAVERQKLAVERQLIFAPEQTGARQAQRMISAVRMRMDELMGTAESLLNARRLATRVLCHVPDDIRDFRCQTSSLVVSSVDFAELKSHLLSVEQLLLVLNRPWSAATSDIENLNRLIARVQRSEKALAAARKATVLSAAAATVSTWQEFRIQMLLQSTQISADDRGLLLAALQNVAPAEPALRAGSSQRSRDGTRTSLPSGVVRQHAELELLRCRLMSLGHPELEEQFAQLRELFEEPGDDAVGTSRWNDFAVRLRSLHGRLSAEIGHAFSDIDPPHGPLSDLQLTIALTLLPVELLNDLELPISPSLSDLRQTAILDSQLTLQQKRVLLALQDAPTDEMDVLMSQLSDQDTIPLRDRALEIDLPAVLPLTVGETIRLPVKLFNPGADSVDVRMLTEADDRLIRIEASPGFSIQTAQNARRLNRAVLQQRKRELTDLLRAGAVEDQPEHQARIQELAELVQRGDYPLSAASVLESPTVTVPPGQRRVVPLTVSCLKGTMDPTWLTLRLQTSENDYRYDLSLEVPREHPVIPDVSGAKGTVSRTQERTQFNGIPNAHTSFVCRLQSLQSSDCVVSASLLAASSPVTDLPDFAMSPDAANAWLRIHAASPRLAVAESVTILANGQAEVAFGPPDEPAPAAKGEPTASDSGGSDSEDPESSSSDVAPAPPVSLDHGVIMSIRDDASGTVSLFHFPVTVQHPGRFVKARARRDETTGELVVNVSVMEDFVIPSESLSLELGFPSAPDAGKLVGSLTTERREAEFRASRLDTKQGVAELSVNGHQRAFVWKLSGVDANGFLATDTDSLAVRILDPQPEMAYRSPTDTISVAIDVEAPPGFPRSANDQLVIGIDANRDRDLIDEATLAIRGTQSIRVWWGGLTDEGRFRLGSTVSPLIVELPTAQFSTSVNLLARLSTTSQTVWSPAVPLCFDGSRPRLKGLGTVPPDQVATGAALQVVVTGSDGDSSGIEKVVAGFVGDDPNAILETPPPTPLALTDGRWVGSADTTGLMPGPATLVVQATDRAGNQSVLVRRTIDVISAEQAAQMEKEAANDIRGTILYGGQPVAGCEVSIAPPAAESAEEVSPDVPLPDPVRTDEVGNFLLKDVRVGQYTLRAFAVVRGLKREKQADVTVEVPPARHRVDLDLR